MTQATRPNWGFLLDELCAHTAGVVHALAVSADGLAVASSKHLTQEHADQLSAFTSGLASLTNGIAALMAAEPVEQTVVDMRDGRIVVMAIGDGSVLSVLAAKNAEIGQVVYEMAMLINSVGEALTPNARSGQRV